MGLGDSNNNGRARSKVDWFEHTDAVMTQLIGIADELCRFLTLPTSSGTHEEAERIMEVSYRLFSSSATTRMAKLTKLAEVLKRQGLSATECLRIRQYERWIGESLENLRQIKMYRTPQALRSFGKIFTM